MTVIAATSKTEIKQTSELNYVSTVLFLLKLPPSNAQQLPDDADGETHRLTVETISCLWI